jgi:hypothetical protein
MPRRSISAPLNRHQNERVGLPTLLPLPLQFLPYQLYHSESAIARIFLLGIIPINHMVYLLRRYRLFPAAVPAHIRAQATLTEAADNDNNILGHGQSTGKGDIITMTDLSGTIKAIRDTFADNTDMRPISERELRLLHMRYVQGMTLQSCADTLGISRSFVQQLQVRAIKNLIIQLYDAFSEIASLKESIDYRRGLFDSDEQTDNVDIKEAALSEHIVYLGLSTRAYNCLTHHGVRCVGDILDLEPEEFAYGIKRFGYVLQHEVIEIMSSLGFTAWADRQAARIGDKPHNFTHQRRVSRWYNEKNKNIN